MKLITRNTDYALRAVCFMAKHKGKVVSVAELTRKLRVPRPFLRKILQSLNRSGILKSLRGQGGGFILAKDATQIFLMDIMRIFQGKLRLNDCLLKKLICPNKRSCPLRKKIAKIESYVLKELSAINIASLLE
ncbi:MAG: Rrf2 family transcriptional regulator [Candidatus Omnitrophica bacterium]|nr:Rrf2 family transcriptional regulator [Candidatus Omnitrophota bacterium]